MKTFFFIYALFFINIKTFAQEKLFCSTSYGFEIREKIDNFKITDKAKHCSLSCLVARKCKNANILLLGFMKELIDIVGPGNSEIEDMKANFQGTYFAFTSKQSCLYLCIRKYPH